MDVQVRSTQQFRCSSSLRTTTGGHCLHQPACTRLPIRGHPNRYVRQLCAPDISSRETPRSTQGRPRQHLSRFSVSASIPANSSGFHSCLPSESTKLFQVGQRTYLPRPIRAIRLFTSRRRAPLCTCMYTAYLKLSGQLSSRLLI